MNSHDWSFRDFVSLFYNDIWLRYSILKGATSIELNTTVTDLNVQEILMSHCRLDKNMEHMVKRKHIFVYSISNISFLCIKHKPTKILSPKYKTDNSRYKAGYKQTSGARMETYSVTFCNNSSSLLHVQYMTRDKMVWCTTTLYQKGKYLLLSINLSQDPQCSYQKKKTL